MRVYLDMCYYNRPYDDQSQIKVSLETQAKLHIQDQIQKKQLELVGEAEKPGRQSWWSRRWDTSLMSLGF